MAGPSGSYQNSSSAESSAKGGGIQFFGPPTANYQDPVAALLSKNNVPGLSGNTPWTLYIALVALVIAFVKLRKKG